MCSKAKNKAMMIMMMIMMIMMRMMRMIRRNEQKRSGIKITN